MKYILYKHATERYSFSDTLPPEEDEFDVIELETIKVLRSAVATEYDLQETIFYEDEDCDEPETQEIAPLPTDEVA